jgi:NAD-dependent SIR2 family protein deacetylase
VLDLREHLRHCSARRLVNTAHRPSRIDLATSSTDHVFVLTLAGVSAENGIPTFRGVGGLWRNYRIEEIASAHAWKRDPRLVWEFYSMRRRVASAATPNPARFALARFEQTLGTAIPLFLWEPSNQQPGLC